MPIAKFHETDRGILTLMGMCLMCVQSAERSLKLALNTVFEEDESAAEKIIVEIAEARKPTLGHFLKELRKRVTLERGFREGLYRFLRYRNIFIHNLKEAPGGWNLKTARGREAAYLFLGELLLMSGTVQAVFLSAVTISSREKLGKDLIENNQLLALMEEQFGPHARKLITGRIK
jgi:hypothetical protein